MSVWSAKIFQAYFLMKGGAEGGIGTKGMEKKRGLTSAPELGLNFHILVRLLTFWCKVLSKNSCFGSLNVWVGRFQLRLIKCVPQLFSAWTNPKYIQS